MNHVKKLKGCRVVLVEWLDASSPKTTEWIPLQDLREPNPMRCLTVGFLFDEGKEAIRIVPTMGNYIDPAEASSYGSILIPKSCILKKETLR